MLKFKFAIFVLAFVVGTVIAGLPGGWFDITDTVEQEDFELVRWSVQQASKLTNFNGGFQLAKILKAERQTILGMGLVLFDLEV
jgi:hypothetical protein